MTLAYNKRKGAMAETALLGWLLERDLPVSRIHLAGINDEGDLHIHGPGGITVIEVKSGSSLNLPGWLRELDAEVANVARHRPGVDVRGRLVVRPNGVVDPARWWDIGRVEERWR